MANYPEPFTILNGQTSAPTPPVRNSGNGWGLVPSAWKAGAVEEAEFKLHAAASNAITAARLLGGSLEPQVLTDDDVDTVDATDNELDIASHAYVTGDGPIRLTTSGTLPAGLAIGTDYWIIVMSSGAISLAETFERAMKGIEIDFGAGSAGTHTVVDTATTKRVKWMSHGLLGESGDGAVALTALVGYRVRVKHSPETVVYGFVGTFGSAEATTATMTPLPLVR